MFTHMLVNLLYCTQNTDVCAGTAQFTIERLKGNLGRFALCFIRCQLSTRKRQSKFVFVKCPNNGSFKSSILFIIINNDSRGVTSSVVNFKDMTCIDFSKEKMIII